MNRKFGRYVNHDPRSKAFKATKYPIRTVRWTRYCAPFDQGDLGSCTGNAMIGALMTGPLYVPGRDFDEQDAVALYSLATHLDSFKGVYPPTDTGSSGLSVAKAAKWLGYISSYHHAFGLDHALAALSGGPVILGIEWWSWFNNPGPNGELEMGGHLEGGHEIVLDEINVEERYVAGTNSWGSSWGDNGRFRIDWLTLGILLSRQGDVVVPVK